MKKINLSMREILDIQDAINTAIEGDYIPYKSRIDDFTIEKKTLSLKEILTYDDYSSWGEWKKNELKNLSKKELFQELENFRGKQWANRAINWLEENNIPSIIIFPEFGLIGDGRGRTNLAVGLGLNKLSVILLK